MCPPPIIFPHIVSASSANLVRVAQEGRIFVDQRVEGLLAEVLQIPAATITDELAMKDVEVWDSLKHMELIVSLEQNFEIQLSFEEIVSMQSVGEIKRVLSHRGAMG
jgi:acyl carrier protein